MALEIDPIVIYDPGFLEKYIIFSKGISLLKVQEKQATTPTILVIESHIHICSETT